MYTDFYNLDALPFQLTPDHRFFFSSTVHSKAMAHLTYGLAQEEGFIIVTGEVGTGKTTLVEYLLSTLDPSRYIAAKIVTTQITGDDMLRLVAGAFGIAHEGIDKAALLGRIEEFLVHSHEDQMRCLLLVDEAQNLTVQALEELRMLSNFQIGEQAPLQSFLLGQPQFRQLLATRELEQLRQRVIAAYHLHPLSEEEVRAYVEHRLKTVGWKNDPEIDVQAYESIYAYSKGVPRKINTLCARLLLYGFLEQRHEIDRPAVERVADDLQQETEGAPAEEPISLSEPAIAPDGGEATPAGGGNGHGEDYLALLKRIEAVEEQVRRQDRTIRRALEIAADFLDQPED